MSKATVMEVNMIDIGLDQRDREILQLVRRFRFMRTDQLCRLFFNEPETTERAKLSRTTRCLHRMEKWGVVAHLARRVRPNCGGTYGLVWYLTETGTRLLDFCREIPKRSRPYEPSEAFLKHALATTEVYTQTVVTARKTNGMELTTVEVEGEAARIHVEPATYLSPSKTMKICPDLFLKLKNIDTTDGKSVNDYWYIEVDLGTERSKAIAGKCQRYIEYYKTGKAQAEHGIFPGVLFVVPDEKRKEAIFATIGKLEDKNMQRVFAVVTLEEYPAQLINGPA